MTMSHAVVQIGHDRAHILQFDAEHVQAEKVKAHAHHTAAHGSKVRTEHEFFGEVCDALADIREVLVVGSKSRLSPFRHYVEKHRPTLVAQVIGYEPVAQPTENQLVAMARTYFLKHDRLTGDAPLG